ncbi:MAG: hypothetical protein K0S99_1448, partial [Thermomicrobiales bacterium]|nr:hypothetical protein [Thermomicrobiales bacterium]
STKLLGGSCNVALALAAVADETDFGCGPQRSRYTTARAAGTKKPHPHGVQQRPLQAAEYRSD